MISTKITTRPKMARNKYGYVPYSSSSSSHYSSAVSANDNSQGASSATTFSATIWGNALYSGSAITDTAKIDTGGILSYLFNESATSDKDKYIFSALPKVSNNTYRGYEFKVGKAQNDEGYYPFDLSIDSSDYATLYVNFLLETPDMYVDHIGGLSWDDSLGYHVEFDDPIIAGGDATFNSVAYFNSTINGQSILPTANKSYSLGSSTLYYKNGYISNLFTDNIENSDNIATKNLEVTGTAHFYELVIDKIKSCGGSLIITPADGFCVEAVTYTGNSTYKLYWKANDDKGNKTHNMWEVSDQALCKDFNNATQGTSYEVSNTYYWTLVKSTDDNTPILGSTITDITSGAVDATSYYHYIEISDIDGEHDGDVIPEAGQNIVMLGHRSSVSTEDDERQNAIFISAYASDDFTESPQGNGLTAPFFAQYRGINDFTLTPHRKSYFDAKGAKFVGNFNVSTGKSIEEYIQEAIEAKSKVIYDLVLEEASRDTDADTITWSVKAYVTNNGTRTLVNVDDYSVMARFNALTSYSPYWVWKTDGRYTSDGETAYDEDTGELHERMTLALFKRDDTALNAPLATTTYNFETKGQDAVLYRILPNNEIASVSANGNLGLYLDYFLYKQTGDTLESIATSSTLKVQYQNNKESSTTWHDFPIGATNPIIRNASYITDYLSNPSSQPTEIKVRILKDGVSVESRIIPIVYNAGSDFTITPDKIKASVLDAYGYSTLEQTSTQIMSQVTTKLGSYSTITQTDTKISASISDVKTDLKRVGITLNGEESSIDITANKVDVKDTSGNQLALINSSGAEINGKIKAKVLYTNKGTLRDGNEYSYIDMDANPGSLYYIIDRDTSHYATLLPPLEDNEGLTLTLVLYGDGSGYSYPYISKIQGYESTDRIIMPVDEETMGGSGHKEYYQVMGYGSDMRSMCTLTLRAMPVTYEDEGETTRLAWVVTSMVGYAYGRQSSVTQDWEKFNACGVVS